MRILAIETSCDETSLAVVESLAGSARCLAVKTYSQIQEHAIFRGVVPEIASRAHLEKINYLYESVLKETGLSATGLDAVAVTTRPGLIGALLVGAQFARTLALAYGLKIVACDHVEAHFYALELEGPALSYPCLGLLLSGGNSAIYRLNAPGNMELLVDTQDDALGEAFDKCASVLGLSYPGGPAIEQVAKKAPESELILPPILRELSPVRFSFSGIKTAVLRAKQQGLAIEQIARSFQVRSFELVERVLQKTIQNSGLNLVVAGGGVLANGRLRTMLEDFSLQKSCQIRYPQSRSLCTDNAAMVGALGLRLAERAQFVPLDFSVSSRR